MNICSLVSLACACVVVVVFHLFSHRGERRLFLTLVNFLFLYSLVPNNASWLCLLFFLGSTYGFLRAIKARPSYNSIVIFIGFTLVVFIFMKGYLNPDQYLPEQMRVGPIAVIGLSYMLFKFIHMLVDQWQGQLEPFDLLSYANYQLSFFTLLAGPIQRYNDFHRSWQDMDAQPEDVPANLQSWSRVLTGMLKMGVLAPLVEQLFVGQSLKTEPAADLLTRFAAQFYGFPVYLYLNFSGYTDMMIGVDRLLGFQLPENFNHPYLARNVIDFWNRWHMSLTHWIRDYIFMTSYKRVAETVPHLSKPLGYFLLFLALVIAGIWHGVSLGFAVFGLIHGIGVAWNQANADALKARLGREGMQRYQKNRWNHALAVFVTFHFVCFSFLFFALDVRPALEFIRAAFGRVLTLIYTLDLFFQFAPIGLALLVLLLIWRFVGPYVKSLAASVRALAARHLVSAPVRYVLLVGKTALVALLFLSMWIWKNQDPVLAYMRF